ncbi:hypothetical protein KM043_012648 [Ampulex compressa]|nr:hypothetical protein KM043_012648 [Ampulex compressa]
MHRGRIHVERIPQSGSLLEIAVRSVELISAEIETYLADSVRHQNPAHHRHNRTRVRTKIGPFHGHFGGAHTAPGCQACRVTQVSFSGPVSRHVILIPRGESHRIAVPRIRVVSSFAARSISRLNHEYREMPARPADRTCSRGKCLENSATPLRDAQVFCLLVGIDAAAAAIPFSSDVHAMHAFMSLDPPMAPSFDRFPRLLAEDSTVHAPRNGNAGRTRIYQAAEPPRGWVDDSQELVL